MDHVTGIFIAIRSRDFTNYWTFERVSRCRSPGFERACTRVINADTRLTFINAVFARSFRKILLTSTLYIHTHTYIYTIAREHAIYQRQWHRITISINLLFCPLCRHFIYLHKNISLPFESRTHLIPTFDSNI